jgi:GNAT superfamily N-acetyltransferase
MHATIRPASADDLPSLPAIERSAGLLFAGTHMAWALDLPPRRATAYQTSLDASLLWVAHDDVLVGFIAGSLADEGVFIEELSVARSHQRRGIGRALLERLLHDVTQRGLYAVGLTTDRDLPWNRPFYRTAGFIDLSPDHDAPWLSDRLRREAQHGHDAARRCAMIRLLDPVTSG